MIIIYILSINTLEKMISVANYHGIILVKHGIYFKCIIVYEEIQ